MEHILNVCVCACVRARACVHVYMHVFMHLISVRWKNYMSSPQISS